MKVYQENIKRYNAKLLQLNKLLTRNSFLRLFIFLISGIILIYLFSNELFLGFFIVLLVSIIGFGAALNYHSKIAFLKKHTGFLKSVNEAEILKKNCDLEEFDPGNEFIDQNHPYTSDLDIFGQHSIFQLINRTTTEIGKVLLAKWMSQPTSQSEIYLRQIAIKEISQNLEWSQDFQATGMHYQNKRSDYIKLLSWVEKPNVLLENQLVLTTMALLLPILFLFSVYFFYANLGSNNAFIYMFLMIVVLVINSIILKKVHPLAEAIVETSTKNLNTLRGYHSLINKIESKKFKSKKLKDSQSILKKDTYSAYTEIHRLCKILDYSQQKPIKGEPFGGNPFYPFLNFFLLLDIHLIMDTEKWKTKNKDYLKLWAEVVSEFEVTNSFAGFCYSNPSYTFPEITEKSNYVHFKSVGHPLINLKKRVCNNFLSDGQGNVVMITGSNMGGKSTFLRSVGVNLVLALAGAPCCVKYGQVTKLKLFTSMRTQDNLKGGISSFYAELNRIEKLLKLIGGNDNVFFLLDEMFKGTNSEDRYKGGFSFINQMCNLNTSGIIATHDIELAKLSGKKMLVTNYSFNSEIIGESMVFNYELQPGICSDFNASVLMEKSGIKIIPNIPDTDLKIRP